MEEEGTIEAAVQSSSRTPTSMDRTRGMQGMPSHLALRIRRLMQERPPTMPTCSMPISSGWPARLGSPSLGVALTVIGTAVLATAAHQVLQGDPSMALQCLEQTMQRWDTATTTAGTGVRQRTLR